jgi:hypothetical protein
VHKVLLQEERDFNSPTVSESDKCTACQNLYNPTTAGSVWDIYDLAAMGLNKGNKGCQRTVYYEGKCVWASALNYILFGKANKLCHDKRTPAIPVYWVYGVPVGWYESDMNLAIIWHKFGPGGGSIFTRESWAAFDFAAEGYTGRNPHNYPDGPGCYTENIQPYTGSMAWHWDNFFEANSPVKP